MAPEFPTLSSQELSLTQTRDAEAQRLFAALDRIDAGTLTDEEIAEDRRQAQARHDERLASRRWMDEMVALCAGKVSTASASSNTTQRPVAPAVEPDRHLGAPVIEVLSSSSISLPTPTPTPTPTPISTQTITDDAVAALAATKGENQQLVVTITPQQRQLILDCRARYPFSRRWIKENPVVRPVAWKRLTETEEHTVLDQFLEDRGATAFTLNLSPDTEDDLIASVRVGKKLTQVIAAKIFRQFRRRKLPVPHLTFRVEAAPLEKCSAGFDKTHLHGVILFDAPLDAEQLAAARDALKHVGGRFPDGDTGRQLDFCPFYNGRSRWRRYASKDLDRTIDVLGTDDLSYTSNSLKRLASEAHEERRAEKKPRKSVAADPVENSPAGREQVVAAVLEELPAGNRPSVTQSESPTSASTDPLERQPPVCPCASATLYGRL